MLIQRIYLLSYYSKPRLVQNRSPIWRYLAGKEPEPDACTAWAPGAAEAVLNTCSRIMRLARAARAVLAKSPRVDAHSDPETGPLAELAALSAENVRLRSDLAEAKAQLSAHLLTCEAPTSAEGPWRRQP